MNISKSARLSKATKAICSQSLSREIPKLDLFMSMQREH